MKTKHINYMNSLIRVGLRLKSAARAAPYVLNIPGASRKQFLATPLV